MEKMTLEKLARMMQGEFLSSKKEMREGFSGINSRFDKLEKEVAEMRIDLDNIKLRLDNEKVYRFEIKSLEKRLNRIEVRLGLK